VTPGGFGACNTSSDEEPAKSIAANAVTDTTQIAYLGMSVTVTSAPTGPNTWDFTFIPFTTPGGGDVTHNKARTSVAAAGGGQYRWYTHNNGFDSLVSGNINRSYGTQYKVFIVGDIANSNCWVFVDPPDNTTNSLFAMTPDAHDLVDYKFTFVHDIMRTFAEQNGYAYVDLLPAMKGLRPEETWAMPGDPHPNALAHKLMAESIFPLIVQPVQAQAPIEK